MRRTARWCLLALMGAGSAGLPSLAHASCEPTPQQSAKNADGSTLRLRTECPRDGIRVHVIELGCPGGGACDRLEIEQDTESFPMGGAATIDIDGDGMHEVEVRGMCGAGPNCEGDLYRIDRDQRKLYHFFSGGYADLQVIDGYLVEGGRASCCAWEFHGWRLDGKTPPLTYDNIDLMANVSASGDEDGNVTAVECSFSVRNGDNWKPVLPPSPAWLRICEHYGEPYRLVAPE